jgi:hypothetical protein
MQAACRGSRRNAQLGQRQPGRPAWAAPPATPRNPRRARRPRIRT